MSNKIINFVFFILIITGILDAILRYNIYQNGRIMCVIETYNTQMNKQIPENCFLNVKYSPILYFLHAQLDKSIFYKMTTLSNKIEDAGFQCNVRHYYTPIILYHILEGEKERNMFEYKMDSIISGKKLKKVL